jgi:predicted HAD superfamily hydrolase
MEKLISINNRGMAQTQGFDLIVGALNSTSSRVDLFTDRSFQKMLFDRIESLMPAKGILSLDVFDTLLLRDDSSELTRFIEIGSYMAESAGNINPIDAFIARHMATKASYRAGRVVNGSREGSLTDIHRTASRLLGRGDEMTETFIETELDYETGRLQVNHLLLDYVCTHCEMGGRIILVSDMYMHADQIERLISKMGVDTRLFEQIFSSADSKVSKASGGIFSLIEKSLDMKTDDFLHIGDSLNGDFQKPLMHGWKALHLPIPHAEIELRRCDHMESAEKLKQQHGLNIDISMPL